MNIFKRIKSFFFRPKNEENRKMTFMDRCMDKVVPREPLTYTRRQWKRRKRLRRISSRSRMYNLLNA